MTEKPLKTSLRNRKLAQGEIGSYIVTPSTNQYQIRYFESQLQFRQQELHHAQGQVKDLEHALSKVRSFSTQQQELYSEAIKSCTLAETRAAEVERELLALKDEMANRSTCEEAAERNRQWALALERVGELERALDGEPSTQKAFAMPLPPIAAFSDQADMDAVASLFVTLQRIREERDTLRGSVEFLSFELRAKEHAVEQRLESQRSSSQLLLQSAEDDVAQLRRDLTSCEARLLQSHEDSLRALEECNMQLYRTQAMSTAAFVALQHTNAQKDSEAQMWMANVTQLESMLEEERQANDKAQAFKADIEQRDRSMNDLNDRYAEATRNLRDTTRELRKLQEKFNDLEEARGKLEGSLEEESVRYRDLEREHSSQVIAYHRLEETHNILREELYEARMEADQLRNNHMTDLARESPDAQSVLQGHIEELDARIIRRNEQIGTQQNDIRRLDMNLRIAENAVEEMRLELGELRAQNISLQEDAATVRHERNHAEKELDLARGDLDALRTSVDKRENLLRQNEEARGLEIATLVEVISTHSLQVQNVTRELGEAQVELSELQNLLKQTPAADRSYSVPTSHQEELEKLRQTITDISASHEQDSSLLKEYSRRVEALEQSLQEATDRGDALAHQLRRANQLARDEVDDRMYTLEGQVDSLSAEVEELEERLAEGQQHIQTVLKQNGDLENQVTDLEEIASAKSRENKEKVEELTAKIQTLQDELDGLRAANITERIAMSEALETLKQEHSASLERVKEVDEIKARAQTLQVEGQALATQLAQVSSDLQMRTAENVDLLRRVNETSELKAIVQRQDVNLHTAEVARLKAEQDLSTVQGDLKSLQDMLGEKNAALEQCRHELSQASIQ
jgi:chromosome segregation ATPase